MDPISPEPPPLDHLQQTEALSRLRAEQNLPLALLAGSAASILGALIWAAVTVSTEYQIGWMAVGVGFAVGFAVRLGKGIDKLYGALGAGLSLVGCLLGNFFSLLGFISKQEEMGLLQVASSINYSLVPEMMISTGSPMDLLFYGIAIYEGYKFSFRKVEPIAAASL